VAETPSFELRARCGRARRGVVHTPHGFFDTPAFVPVGTRATVKGLTPAQLSEAGCQIVLANTYHLLLRPGPETVEQLGGLHRFMGWDGPMLTDSGGYQVFSLTELRALDDDGVEFRSHVDGALIRLTPELSIRVQNQLGADIIMALDECPPLAASARVDERTALTPADDPIPPPATPSGSATQIEQAVRRTVAWARRSKAAHARAVESAAGPPQALFGIVQGGLDLGLRAACLEPLLEIGFDGYALGGLSVGEPPEQMWELCDAFAERLPADRPRYLMGVGRPVDLVQAVAAGIDLFDCVLPTRNGRKGYAFTSAGVLRLRNTRHRLSAEPLDPGCTCYTCRRFSRAYLRHLLMSAEVLGGTLVSLHNLCFYQALMAEMRASIERGEFDAWRRALLAGPVGSGSEDES
jgi:queuine tRNA-ribosyltransferase